MVILVWRQALVLSPGMKWSTVLHASKALVQTTPSKLTSMHLWGSPVCWWVTPNLVAFHPPFAPMKLSRWSNGGREAFKTSDQWP